VNTNVFKANGSCKWPYNAVFFSYVYEILSHLIFNNMKHLSFVLSFIFLSLKVHCQDISAGMISVLGIASTEIIPNEIYYKIEIQDIKDGKNPMLLDEIEQHFLEISKQLQIDSTRIFLTDAAGRKFQLRRNQSGMIHSKTYEILFRDAASLDSFITAIETIPVYRSGIVRIGHSRILQIEEEMKAEAVKNARSKAEKLANSSEAQLGKVLIIDELADFNLKQYASNYYLYNYYTDALNSGHLSGEEAIAKLDYTLRPIKLVATVQVKFELQ